MFHNEDPKILGAIVQNLVARNLCTPETHSRNPLKLNTRIILSPWGFYVEKRQIFGICYVGWAGNDQIKKQTNKQFQITVSTSINNGYKKLLPVLASILWQSWPKNTKPTLTTLATSKIERNKGEPRSLWKDKNYIKKFHNCIWSTYSNKQTTTIHCQQLKHAVRYLNGHASEEKDASHDNRCSSSNNKNKPPPPTARPNKRNTQENTEQLLDIYVRKKAGRLINN